MREIFPNGVHIRVNIATESDAWVVVRVSDSGIGIPAGHLKGIFKRFYRVPNMSMLK